MGGVASKLMDVDSVDAGTALVFEHALEGFFEIGFGDREGQAVQIPSERQLVATAKCTLTWGGL